MSNEMTTLNVDDGWGDAAEEANERIIRGTFLKFADWRWTAGQEGRVIQEGTKMVAIDTAAAWVRWEAGKPVEYVVRKHGEHLPERESLGHTQDMGWEAGPDGKPRDPWQNTRFVHFIDPTTAEEFTWSTSSMGGIAAVSSLGGPVIRKRTELPRAMPVVELRFQDMKTRFGKKSKPWLKIVDWVGGKPQEPALKQIEHNPAKEPVRGDMQDEIPF